MSQKKSCLVKIKKEVSCPDPRKSKEKKKATLLARSGRKKKKKKKKDA